MHTSFITHTIYICILIIYLYTYICISSHVLCTCMFMHLHPSLIIDVHLHHIHVHSKVDLIWTAFRSFPMTENPHEKKVPFWRASGVPMKGQEFLGNSMVILSVIVFGSHPPALRAPVCTLRSHPWRTWG